MFWVRKTRNRNARKLLEARKPEFQNFAQKCQKAIRDIFPGSRFAYALRAAKATPAPSATTNTDALRAVHAIKTERLFAQTKPC